MTKDEDDIIRAFVRRLADAGMPKVDAVLLELELRAEYGGQRHYVPRKGKAWSLNAAVGAGVDLKTAIRDSGLGRGAVYAALGRPWVIDW
jgi:hypothetical protein